MRPQNGPLLHMGSQLCGPAQLQGLPAVPGLHLPCHTPGHSCTGQWLHTILQGVTRRRSSAICQVSSLLCTSLPTAANSMRPLITDSFECSRHLHQCLACFTLLQTAANHHFHYCINSVMSQCEAMVLLYSAADLKWVLNPQRSKCNLLMLLVCMQGRWGRMALSVWGHVCCM